MMIYTFTVLHTYPHYHRELDPGAEASVRISVQLLQL